MILPQANLKAKDLPKPFVPIDKREEGKVYKYEEGLLPHVEVVKAYEAVGQEYERINSDRVYEWWYNLVTASERLKQQPIEQRIDSMSRLKDSKGEWLTFQMSLSAKDWKGNRKDFWYDQGGKMDGYPEFIKEIDPQTDQVIAGTTQINELKTIYKLPFSKEKFNELSEYCSETCGFAVKDRGGSGRRYSCSFEQFRDLSYDELIGAVTAYLYSDSYKLKQMIEATKGVAK